MGWEGSGTHSPGHMGWEGEDEAGLRPRGGSGSVAAPSAALGNLPSHVGSETACAGLRLLQELLPRSREGLWAFLQRVVLTAVGCTLLLAQQWRGSPLCLDARARGRPEQHLLPRFLLLMTFSAAWSWSSQVPWKADQRNFTY